MRTISLALTALLMAACGQAAAPDSADAQPAAAAAPAAEVSAADRTAILTLMNTPADASGQVENECGERVTPKFETVELGGAVGAAVLLVMEGGPNAASCYGDGPGLSLWRRDGANFTNIYSSRGAMLVVMPARGNNARDLVEGGPGFEHPLYMWNGTEYAFARSIADQQMGDNLTYLPTN